MNTYEPEHLLSLWRRGRLDLEMAMGHVLQHLVILYRGGKLRPNANQPPSGKQESDQKGGPHDE